MIKFIKVNVVNSGAVQTYININHIVAITEIKNNNHCKLTLSTSTNYDTKEDGIELVNSVSEILAALEKIQQ